MRAMNPIQPTSISTDRDARRHAGRFAVIGALAIGLGLLTTSCASSDGNVEPGPAVSDQPTDASTAPQAASTTDTTAPVATDGGSTAGATSVESAATGDADRAAELAAMAGAASVTVVEDWAKYASANEVEATIDRNLGMGDNTMDLTLTPASGNALPAGNVLGLTYAIGEAAPNDFVGFNRSLDAPADWSGAKGVAFWADGSAAPGVDVVFQFREGSGEVWRYEGAMPAAVGGALVSVMFDGGAFKWADWSTTGNGQIDLAVVDQYGVYVGHQGTGKTGVARVGPIVLLR